VGKRWGGIGRKLGKGEEMGGKREEVGEEGMGMVCLKILAVTLCQKFPCHLDWPAA
jgi:hypothetical protein